MITDCREGVQQADETLCDALDVSYRGNVYPDRPEPPKEQRQSALRLRYDSGEVRFGQRLATELWERLPFATIGQELPSEPDPLIDRYISSLRAIDQFQVDVGNFIRTLCELNLSHRQDSGSVNLTERDRAWRDKVNEMMSRADLPLRRPENKLSAPLKVQPVPQLHECLANLLRDSLRDFGQQFEVILQQLAAQRVLGLIEWLATNDCRYHYFKEFLVQDSQGIIKQLTSLHHVKNGRRDQVLRRTQDIQAGTTTHVWQRHEHHVMHAVESKVTNSRVEMPPLVQRLIDAIPEWLEDSITVVDGTIYRERVIEHTYHRDRWVVMEEPVEERVYGWDPAIVIDHFVLTGWGPSDVEAERARRTADAQQQARCSSREMAWYDRIVWGVGASATGIGAAMLLAQGWHSTFNSALLWAILLIMLWSFAIAELVRAQGLVAGIVSNWRHYSVGFLVASAFLVSTSLMTVGNQIASLFTTLLGLVMLSASLMATVQIHRLWERPTSAAD